MAKKPEENHRDSGGAAHASAGGKASRFSLRTLVRWPFLLSIVAAASVSSVGISYLTRHPEAPPETEFQAALKYLDEHRERSAQGAAPGSNDKRGGDSNELL